jgi:hypothetical protein
MKTQKDRFRVLLPLVLAVGVASSQAGDLPNAGQNWGLKDLPKLATPTGVVRFARDEIRSEANSFRHDVADLRAGKPKAIIELSFASARLAGASAGAVMGARLAYHFASLDAHARNERLDTALPRTLAQAPDRGFQRMIHATLRSAVTGNWNVGQAITGEFSGQAVELAPAALNSTHDAAQNISAKFNTPRS